MTSLSKAVASNGPIPVDEAPGSMDVSDKMAGVAKFKITGAHGDGLRPGNTRSVYYDVHKHSDDQVLAVFLEANPQLRDRLSPRSMIQALTSAVGLDRDIVGPQVREFYGEERWSEAFSNHGAAPSGKSLSTHLSESDSVSEAVEAHEAEDGGDTDEAT